MFFFRPDHLEEPGFVFEFEPLRHKSGPIWHCRIPVTLVNDADYYAYRRPRRGRCLRTCGPISAALLLTLPIISIVAFVAVWQKEQDLSTINRLARETLVLVPLGLPFFVPLAFSERLGLGFWTAFSGGVVLASVSIELWFWLEPWFSSPTR